MKPEPPPIIRPRKLYEKLTWAVVAVVVAATALATLLGMFFLYYNLDKLSRSL